MAASSTVADDQDHVHYPSHIRVAKADARPGPARAEGRRAGRRARSGRPLGKNTNNAASAGQSTKDSRATRLRALRAMQPLTSLKRVSKCGRVSVVEGGSVMLRLGTSGDGSNFAGIGGVSRCGSVWSCPCCSAKISASRASELEKAVRWNAERGGTVALVTLTMRHHKGHRLKTLRAGLTGAWRHITSSRAWKDTRADLGRDHYVRAIEATHGDNGWHLHIHALLFFDGAVSPEMIGVLSDELWELWRTGLERQGLDALREHAVDVRVGGKALEGMGKYLSKLVFEAVGQRWKKGRGGGRTPFELLGDFLATGNAADWDLWEEWEKGSHGMRQLVWSRGLKEVAAVGEKSDEEIAAEDEGGVTIAELPARTWAQVWCEVEHLLAALEIGGADAACRWLDARHLAYELREFPHSDVP